MSFLSQGLIAQVGTSIKAPSGALVHIRTATKKVSGSKTNKNDSAGRRLGPKAYENHFVKTGQIIMRQRGTKIHPGENVGLGRDHTIFALEPGYVRFYLDPFHPLRKYVGVALRKDIQLPKPHFDPRIRRFGYKPLDPKRAEAEMARMSRKELLAQPELKKRAEEFAKETSLKISAYSACIAELLPYTGENDQISGATRLLFIARKLALNETYAYASEQATFNVVHELVLLNKRGEISKEELNEKTASYIAFAKDFDSKISVDFTGAVHPYYNDESRAAKAHEIREKLKEFKEKLIGPTEKSQISDLISEAGIFDKEERQTLTSQYLPKVLPESVPGTVIEGVSSKKIPKNAVAVRTFDSKNRTVATVLRTKDAFLQ
ncbi:hypothetical protein METBIDRAFT_57681 [Metschnikowia bicuspidata var. bicuspidata NRRL YB-4993]|uniref:Large ribosomal subunit protein bL27m n=1 Tax=Metschnikowia bicuspidata var. bicuspidata NRRL YB-4993 TaxID=869754 RepID=A0A1A0H8S3_9ASCO|nr:hypothetical protein METBIDRAFT_57681 [Metschnikowia bicuspidata var. bicuspidata NRRL YB-4993]OBA20519.1 hypothetical protein METBIDRAFT_57681 [Metschnikowia bicuspidata var. bicuspidata NRRL YB-4993]